MMFNRAVTICRRIHRYRNMYFSSTNSVHVYVGEQSGEDEGNGEFLIKYEGIF